MRTEDKRTQKDKRKEEEGRRYEEEDEEEEKNKGSDRFRKERVSCYQATKCPNC